MKTLEPLVQDEMDSSHALAKEMRSQIEDYFGFLLDTKCKEFLPVYWVASFLCPVYRFILSSDELPVVRSYLESKFSVVIYSFLTSMIQGAVSPLIDAPATSSNNNIKLLLPGGLSCLSETLTQTLNQCESGRDVRDKLDRDIDVYIRSADSHCAKLKAKAEADARMHGKCEAEMVAEDPLDFWINQVMNICLTKVLIYT